MKILCLGENFGSGQKLTDSENYYNNYTDKSDQVLKTDFRNRVDIGRKQVDISRNPVSRYQ